MTQMQQLLFGAALLAALTVFVLLILQVVRKGFEFWPPPSALSWQSHTFRTLFRVFFVSLIGISILDFDTTQPTWRYFIGTPLFLVGFGLALRWTNFLGWGNAFGSSDGLKTNGIYQFSRNPIYVISIIGMIGWAMLAGSWMVTTLLTIWACLYIAAPFLEEPWMRKQYSDAFNAYISQVPRYGSLRAITRNALTKFELKVPPLVIILICVAVMYTSAVTVPHSSIVPMEMRVALALVAGIFASVVLLAALVAFRRHQTTVNPLNPNNTTSLVTTGIYAYSRNPMYLSMFLVLLGWGFFLGQLNAVGGLVLYVVTITRIQILPEERILERKFGSAYTDFLTSSCRWFGFRHSTSSAVGSP